MRRAISVTSRSETLGQRIERAMRTRREFINRGNGDVADIPDEQCIQAADAIADLLATMHCIHLYLGVRKPSADAINEAKNLAEDAIRRWDSK